MAKVPPTFTFVKQQQFEEVVAELSAAIVELLNRTARIAEVTAALALVLRENGLIDIPVERNAEDDTASVDLNAIAPAEQSTTVDGERLEA